MNHQFRENYAPEQLPARIRWQRVAMAVIYVAAAVVICCDLFIWRAA